MVILEVSPAATFQHLCQAGRWNRWFLGDQGRRPRSEDGAEELWLHCEVGPEKMAHWYTQNMINVPQNPGVKHGKAPF